MYGNDLLLVKETQYWVIPQLIFVRSDTVTLAIPTHARLSPESEGLILLASYVFIWDILHPFQRIAVSLQTIHGYDDFNVSVQCESMMKNNQRKQSPCCYCQFQNGKGQEQGWIVRKQDMSAVIFICVRFTWKIDENHVLRQHITDYRLQS